MRTLPIHLERLDAALKAKGVSLKRHNLIEVAAAAFGYHNENQFTAAAKTGDLDPVPARGLGLITAAGRQMVMLEDEKGRPFAIDATIIQAKDKANAFVTTPYGGLVDLRCLEDRSELSGAAASRLHFATVTHEYGANLFWAPTEEGLKREIADWCREYWSAESVPGSYEGLSDDEVCEAYFEHAEEDGVTYFPEEHGPLVPGSAASRADIYIPEGFDQRSAYIISRMTGDAEEPYLYWSTDNGWVCGQSATVFDAPLAAWPTAGIDPGTLAVIPLPARPSVPDYPRHDVRSMDVVFLTNRDCDVQGPQDRAAEALPWVEAAEMDVGLGTNRRAELGYSAMVVGEVYLAPTIKAFHFDAENPVRVMLENRRELEEYANAIERSLEAVGGLTMFEEDGEAVTLTIFIPLTEARRAPDLETWKEALQELLTPNGLGPRVLANFRPQAMVSGACYDADPLGETLIDITYEVKLMGEEATRTMHDTDLEGESLKDAVRAPAWIKEWSGPFGIEAREAIANHFGFDSDVG
ncbi:hypothetical protein [Sphingomonas sp. 3-13AW]|uniref:hypothetical protein n=1 Tax=Sphingomonas sp. 3-13AW TaxID=3050450 RepID=UPI003BB4EE6B